MIACASRRRAARAVVVAAAAPALLAGCLRQPVPAEHAEYIGHWRGDGARLVITADGYGDFERVRGRERETVTGAVRHFSATGFRIGVPGFATEFAVSEPPQLRDGRWRLVFGDGLELARVDILPTPAEPVPAP